MRQARDEWKWKDKDRKARDDKEDRHNRKFRAGWEESRHIGKNGRKKCRHMRQECLEKRANGKSLKGKSFPKTKDRKKEIICRQGRKDSERAGR